MKSLFCNIFFVLAVATIGQTQINYTANDFIQAYDASFGFGTNLGYYSGWTDEQLADIAIGNHQIECEGVGINSLRASLPEEFLENWGYDIRVNTFDHYGQLGATENVVFIGTPSNAHRDPQQYCPGVASESFANLYEPIWDNGENNTPVNDNNYYALYLYKMVTRYHQNVRFWEITNEPDYDYSGDGWKDQNYEGNWFDNVPSPCDYAFRAPITHYIRMLRVSYEVIKSIDPDAYIAVGGLGYPSFLDLILRHTDNPSGGTVTEDYPLYGGAYFDVLSFHSYPHINGSLRYWSNDAGGFVYERHSDRAVQGLIDHQNDFREVLEHYGYDNALYPEKLWIITETNLPRRSFSYFGSNEAQRNFAVKALIKSQQHDILQVHTYQLGDRANESSATDEFHVMGMYKYLASFAPYEQTINDIGVAYATTSILLKDKKYDAVLTAQLNLQENQDGAVFKSVDGTEEVIALWTKTIHDWSEAAFSTYTLPASFASASIEGFSWDYSRTQSSTLVNPSGITLSASPVFLKKQITTNTNEKLVGNIKSRCYPNPVSETLNLDIALTQKSAISVSLLDALGRPLATLVNHQEYLSGTHHMRHQLPALPSGVYQIQIRSNHTQKTHKIIVH